MGTHHAEFGLLPEDKFAENGFVDELRLAPFPILAAKEESQEEDPFAGVNSFQMPSSKPLPSPLSNASSLCI